MEPCSSSVLITSIFVYLYPIKAIITMIPGMGMVHFKTGRALNFVAIKSYAALA